MADPRRRILRTDALLAEPRLEASAQRLGRRAVKAAIVVAQQQARDGSIEPEQVADAALAALPSSPTALRSVINATGVVLHTNLGRAPLSAAAIEAIAVAAGYVDVEFDLSQGRRDRRGRATLAAMRARVPDAGDAMVVNNGAAAIVLAVTVLAVSGLDASGLAVSESGAGREVVVSRGEMVEIGDGFRLPDLIESTGARIREVGTTNRTTRADYADAIGPSTRCIVKIHPSNFRIAGYTSSVPVAELATLGVPVIADIGSGLLQPDPMLPDEPDVSSTLQAGAALVTCSGDKLLGGPQAGLIFGQSDLVERLRRHSLARALRVDKLTLAAMEATLLGPETPAATYLRADPRVVRARCARVVADVGRAGIDAAVVASVGAVGGGSAPELSLPGWAVALPSPYADLLRRGDPPVIGRVEHRRCLLDLRCVPPEDDQRVTDAILAASVPPDAG